MSSSISGISIAPILARASSTVRSTAKTLSTASKQLAGKPAKAKGKAGASLFAQIEQAVTNALQSTPQNDATDPNDVVQNAIEQVFSQNSPPAQANANAEAGNLTLANGGTADSTHSAFLKALKANGIDPEQFKTDFFAAIKDAKTGDASVATALKSLSTGSLLDAIA
ncbi:MAG TPA: hypothetical protein VHY37_02205 [Tepidisphaeraceae bacterium]|jgi:hypothetical protein|nr:hypothetical protein [Tepidisphaeraceae bacterium]